MSTYNKIWLVVSFIFIVIVAIFGISHSYWGDELHFVETIRLFISSSWVELIKDYPEVTTPLVYMIYAVWGKLFGADLITLRLLSLIISFLFLNILYLYVKAYVKNDRFSFILCLIALINPYLWGFSVFVFTDMMTLLFVFTALYFFRQDKPLLTSFFLGLSILCRQYAIIFIVGVWLFVLLKSVYNKNYNPFLRYSLYLFIFSLPLLFLVIIWEGISPPSGIEKFMPVTELYWNPHAFISYITFSAIYISPLIILLSPKLWKYKKYLIASLILGFIYLLFPVEVSEVTRVQTNLDTVGLVHRSLFLLAGRGIISNIVLFLFFTIGIWLILIFLADDIKTLKNGNISDSQLNSILFYIFLLIMPLSYQIWEKYLVLILPVVLLRLGLLFRDYITGQISQKISIN